MRGIRVLLSSVALAGVVQAQSVAEFLENSERYYIAVDDKRVVVAGSGFFLARVYCPARGWKVYRKYEKNGIEIEEEYDTKGGTWYRMQNDAFFVPYGYCKDEKGNVVLEWKDGAVVHPPAEYRKKERLGIVLERWYEKVRDFDLEQIAGELAGGLFSKKPRPVAKGQRAWYTERVISMTKDTLVPFQSPGDVMLLFALCERRGGTFYRVQEGQKVPFREFVYFLSGGGGIKLTQKSSQWFNPAEAGAVSSYNERQVGKTFEGLYVCEGKNLSFTYSIRLTSTGGIGAPPVYSFSGILKEGVDTQAIEKTASSTGMAGSTGLSPVESLAQQTAKLKAPVRVQQGAIVYETSFNGQEGACSLVSVSQAVSGKLQAIHNYRVCGERVEYIGESGLPALPQGIASVRQDIARMCQRFGQAELLYEGTTIKCRALRDRDKCLVELTYLQGGRLVGKEEVDGCR